MSGHTPWSQIKHKRDITQKLKDDDLVELKVGEVGIRINRSAHTIRRWERSGMLPEHLLPHRNKKNYRVWYAYQVPHFIDWMRLLDLRKGKVFIAQTKGMSANGWGQNEYKD